MKTDQTYKNGQKKCELADGVLTWFFKDGQVKARGPHRGGKMQGTWQFFREGGQLWVLGNFIDDIKHGPWQRFDKTGRLEFHAIYEAGKEVRMPVSGISMHRTTEQR